MWRDTGELDERFAAFVRSRGDHHLRMAALLTGDWQDIHRPVRGTWAWTNRDGSASSC